MKMGTVLMFGVFVTLGTWGYLKAFAPTGSDRDAEHAFLLPTTWADSPRDNPDGRWEARVVLGGVSPVPNPPLPKTSQVAIKIPAKKPAVADESSASRGAVPLPARRPAARIAVAANVPLPVRSPATRIAVAARVLDAAAVPLPERSPGMTRIISAQMLPVRRPEELVPVGVRVAQAAEAAKRRRVQKADTQAFAVSAAGPMEVPAPAVVNQAMAVNLLVNVPAAPRRRPDFGQRWSLGGPR